MSGITMTTRDAGASVWDCGRRRTGRPWHLLGLLGVLAMMNIGTAALMPFLNANADEPAAAWIALALLLAITLKLATTGLFRSSCHLERVVPGSSGVLVAGTRLAHLGAVYQSIEVLVAWRDVAAVESDQLGERHGRGATVEIGLEVATVFGRRVRLVFASRERAEVFAARALALRSGPALISSTSTA